MEFLLKELNVIRKEFEMLRNREERFNIFSALHKENDERRLHSRFISVLLQPKGKHGKGRLFLKLFIDQVKEFEGFVLNDSTLVYPKEDDKKENSNIDILIINRNEKQCIIIENKIYAGDSNLNSGGQIERYINHAIDNESIPLENIYVIYLTLDGHEPTKESVKGYEDFQNVLVYSYEEIILPWLEESLKEVVNQPFLRESINQYIKLVQKMTTNSSSIEERIAYKDLIGSSEENLMSAKKLIDNFIHIKWHTVFDFWNNLQNLIINDSSFQLIKPFDKDTIDSKKPNECIRDITHYEVYRKGQREKQKCEMLFNLKQNIKLKIKYSAITDTFYFGIPIDDNETSKEIADKLIDIYDEYEVNNQKRMLLYKIFDNNIHFNDFSRKETFKLINPVFNRQKSEEVFDEVKELSSRILKVVD